MVHTLYVTSQEELPKAGLQVLASFSVHHRLSPHLH